MAWREVAGVYRNAGPHTHFFFFFDSENMAATSSSSVGAGGGAIPFYDKKGRRCFGAGVERSGWAKGFVQYYYGKHDQPETDERFAGDHGLTAHCACCVREYAEECHGRPPHGGDVATFKERGEWRRSSKHGAIYYLDLDAAAGDEIPDNGVAKRRGKTHGHWSYNEMCARRSARSSLASERARSAFV